MPRQCRLRRRSPAKARLTALDIFARGAVDHLFALETLHIIALAWILVCLAIVAATLRALTGQHPERVALRQRML